MGLLWFESFGASVVVGGLSVCLSFGLFALLFVCLSVGLLVCLFICPLVCQSVGLCVCLSGFLQFVCDFVCWCLCLCLCWCLSFCEYLCLCQCLCLCRCQVLGLGCAMCLVFCWCVVAADVLLLWAMLCRPSTSLWVQVAIGPTCRYFFHWAFDGPGFFAWGLPPGVPGEASPTQKIPGLPRISFVPYTQLHTVHKIGPAGLLK